MAKDQELDRLKTAQDLAYTRKQDAWKAQDRAWKVRAAAKTKLDATFDANQREHESNQAAWDRFKSEKASKGSRIDDLNRRQESAFQNMQRAFDNASSAYSRKDGSASSYAAEGHRYKAESQRYVAERRALVAEIRAARQRLDGAGSGIDQAKRRFADAKREYDSAKSEHLRKKTEFESRKAEFDKASAKFRERLEAVKKQSEKRKQSKKSLAAKAGVPHRYRENVWVSEKPDGTVNIYFGGVGAANGPGHGHYVLDASGKVVYARDPFDPHGAQNFTDSQRDYYDIVAREASQPGEFGFRCRFRGYDAYVETNENKQGQAKIDIYYGPNGPFGPGHHHAGALRESPTELLFDKLR